MTKNPFYNSILAAIYISLVASIMYFGPRAVGEIEPSIIIPIAFLSLFVLSAAVMGYLFLGQPLLMYLDGQKNEAIIIFLQTLAVFATLTVVFLATIFILA